MAARDSSTIASAELHDLPLVADAFSLGPLSSVTFLPAGLMNLNWKVEGTGVTSAVKRLIDVPPDVAICNLAAVEALAEASIPVAVPLKTTANSTIARVEDRAYCAFPWIDGTQPAGAELTVAQAGSLGGILGRLHAALGPAAALAGLSDMRPKRPPVVPDATAAAAHAGRFLASISSQPEPGAFDLAVIPTLHRRRDLLLRHGHEGPAETLPLGPSGWTHGDFQPLNLLWRTGQVAAVLDWDRIRIRPFGEELARSACHLFRNAEGTGLDLDRIAAFVAGYRAEIPLTRAETDDAIDRLWWKRLTDFWILEFHYDRADSSCDHLYASSCAVLDWWTSRRDLVRDVFATGVTASPGRR